MSSSERPTQESSRRRRARWFSDSATLAELACLVDALPKEHRLAILRATLYCTADSRFDVAYIVGTYRTRLYDCLQERLGTFPSIGAIRTIDSESLDTRLQSVVDANDPAQTALALCDLVVFVTDALESAMPSSMLLNNADSWYHVCLGCNAKWFHASKDSRCPRCGMPANSDEKLVPPWCQRTPVFQDPDV